MPRTKTGKGAGGAGSIRKITTTKNGKTYTYWQARYTEGFDPGTGKQMQLHQDKGSKGYELVSPKNGRSRTIAAAQTVLTRLQQQRRWQMQQKLLLGSDWQNSEGLVFTNEFGTHLTKSTVYREYKRIVAAIGCPNARFRDLRHSYAVAAIRAGDDIKTVQGNLGHATAAFTLDVYGHVTDQMKRESADRMERFIQSISAG